MAEDESLPLLLNGDGDEYEERQLEALNPGLVKSQFISNEQNRLHIPFNFQDSISDNDKEEEPDNVIAVFVVAFDMHRGNIVEWFLPDDIDLSTIEFKAMPSGAHTVECDFIYFRTKYLYGLSCFEKMKIDSKEERGVRMKSVGILSHSYTNLFRHMQFLENQVREQLRTPDNFDKLLEFYEQKRALLSSALCTQPSITFKHRMFNFPKMKITHPAGCFAHFVKFFGESIFVLWKLILLRKRILFFSQPPIGVVCYRVYSACCLSKVTSEEFEHKFPEPYFYVNIADIEQLENENSYVACTTEKIFVEKQHLYDIFVDNQIITSTNPCLSDIIKVNHVDKEKYQELQKQREIFLQQRRIENTEQFYKEEDFYQSYFCHLNNQMFKVLMAASQSADRSLTEEHVKAMSLHPVKDRHFIMEILELYGIDLLLVVDNPCCPI